MRMWNKTLILCAFPILLACPVGPDAVKTTDEEGPSEPILTAPQEGGGQMKSPTGSPQNMGGNDMNNAGSGMGANQQTHPHS